METDPFKLGKIGVVVKSATKVFFQGEVAAVSFQNRLGPFDILPNHTNLIALVVDKMTLHFDTKKRVDIPLTRGVVKVENNQVTVFVGI